MVKFLGLAAVCLTVLLASASPAAARPDFRCNGVFSGKTYDEVVVSRNSACTLTRATVKGGVRALKGSYFQATETVVRGDVEGTRVQTLFIDTGSRVYGSVESVGAAQFYVYNSTIVEDIEPERTKEVVQVCGNTVRRGNIEVRGSGPDKSIPVSERPGTDILIGDPAAAGCGGNVVKRGDIVVSRNFTDIEFVIRGNLLQRGSLKVVRNTGPATRFVEDNSGGDALVCRGNGAPFTVADNTGWDRRRSQCA